MDLHLNSEADLTAAPDGLQAAGNPERDVKISRLVGLCRCKDEELKVLRQSLAEAAVFDDVDRIRGDFQEENVGRKKNVIRIECIEVQVSLLGSKVRLAEVLFREVPVELDGSRSVTGLLTSYADLDPDTLRSRRFHLS
jgi:hypothetical protein